MGPYASIYEMATRPTAFMRVIAGVSLPELKMRRGSARVYRVWAASLFGFLSVTTLSVAILSFFRYEIVKFVFGSNLLYTGNAFALIAMTMPISIAGYFCITLLSAEGDFRSPRLHYARGAVFMVIAAYPLIHWRGLDGAAMLFLASRWIDLALLRQTLKRFAIPVSPRAVIVWSGVSIGLLATALSSRAWLFLPCFCVAATLVWVKQLQLIKGLDEKCHG
jgi:O-antigen/teichoic acid export membrane protein